MKSQNFRRTADGGAASLLKRRTARLAALALACLLALPWTGPARAEKSVFFLAADQTVLPLSDDTMPFWQDGFLYISCAIFSDTVDGGTARRNLNITMTQNSDQDKVTLYRGTDTLEFEQGVSFAVDQEGTIFYPGAVWRNGRVFVSADLTARFFDLLYSVTAVEHGSLVWLRNPSFRLQERSFVDAAAWQLNSVYQEYADAKLSRDAAPETRSLPRPHLPDDSDAAEHGTAAYDLTAGYSHTVDRSNAADHPNTAERYVTADRPSAAGRSDNGGHAETAEPLPAEENKADAVRNSTASDAAPPEIPLEEEPTQENPAEEHPTEEQTTEEHPAEEQTEGEPPEIQDTADLYLCLRAGENTSALLDTLDGADVRAAFFCDRAFLEQEGDLVRRMAASGHTIGLFLPGTGSVEAEAGEESDEAAEPSETAEASDVMAEAAERESGAADNLPEPPVRPTARTGGIPGRLAAEAEDCQRVLERAACLRTRLVFLENGTAADRALLHSLGFICPEPGLDVSDALPRSAARLRRRLREAGVLSGRTAVWLGDSATAEGLGDLLDAVQEAEGRCFPLTESAFL